MFLSNWWTAASGNAFQISESVSANASGLPELLTATGQSCSVELKFTVVSLWDRANPMLQDFFRLHPTVPVLRHKMNGNFSPTTK